MNTLKIAIATALLGMSIATVACERVGENPATVSLESVANGNISGLVRISDAQMLGCRKHEIDGKSEQECIIGYVTKEGNVSALFVGFGEKPTFSFFKNGDLGRFLEIMRNYHGTFSIEGSINENTLVANSAYVDGQKYDLWR